MPRPSPSGVLAHLHFFWSALWVTIFMIPFSILQAVSHLMFPTARNFKLWAGSWSRLCMLFAGVRIKVRSEATLDRKQPYVFVSNHQTGALDIWAHLAGIDHGLGFVAKASLRNVPFIGLALRFSACLFVDRSTARKAVKSITEAAERIRTGNSVLIFPEGMRTWSPQTIDFMKGAYQLAVRAGVPIVPVALMNAYELFDERAMASRPGVVEIVIGQPIETSEMTRSEITELAATTRSWIQERLDRYHSADATSFETKDG